MSHTHPATFERHRKRTIWTALWLTILWGGAAALLVHSLMGMG